MPNKKNAVKALRQSKKREERNDKAKHALYDIKRKIKKAVMDGNDKDLEKLVKDAQVILDKATKNKIIKPNSASRKKSSLTKLVNKKEVAPVAKKKTAKKATAKTTKTTKTKK